MENVLNQLIVFRAIYIQLIICWKFKKIQLFRLYIPQVQIYYSILIKLIFYYSSLYKWIIYLKSISISICSREKNIRRKNNSYLLNFIFKKILKICHKLKQCKLNIMVDIMNMKYIIFMLFTNVEILIMLWKKIYLLPCLLC